MCMHVVFCFLFLGLCIVNCTWSQLQFCPVFLVPVCQLIGWETISTMTHTLCHLVQEGRGRPQDPKKHIIARNDVIWRIRCRNRSKSNGLSASESEEPTNEKKIEKRSRVKTISPIRGSKTPEQIVMKFCMGDGIWLPNLVTHAKLGNDGFSQPFLYGEGVEFLVHLLTLVVVFTTLWQCRAGVWWGR